MKIGKIMLVTLLLLAILTIGSVNASDDADFNETLAVDNWGGGVSLDSSLDNELMSEDSEDIFTSSDDDLMSEDSDDIIASSDDENLAEDVTEDNLHPWVSEHEWVDANWDPTIVNVNFDDNVQDGSINLVIVKDEDNTFTDSRNIEDADGNEIRWGLDDLNILDEPGTYTISLDYQIEDNTIPLIEDFTFKLTQFNYAVLGYVYHAYPFDVVRVYMDDEEEYLIEVYVNDNEDPFEPSSENPFRWTLDDLGIDQEGTYSITVRSNIGDDLFEEVTNTLTVDGIYGDKTWLYSSDFGLERWEINGPVLYLLCSGNHINQHFTLYVNDNQVDDFDSEEFMNWTLEDLGIDQNEGYEIRLCNDEGDEIAYKWLDVYGMISEDNFNSWVSSHESINNDDDPWIVNVHAHGDLSEGDVVVTIVNSEGINKTYTKTFEDDADEHNDVIWKLDELNEIINQVGKYTFNVTYINGDTHVDLITDFTFSLTEFDYNIFEGEIYIGYPFDVIRIWDEDLDVEVYVDDSTDPVQSGGTDPLRWTLADLGIESPGDYTITVNANKDGVEDSFSYGLSVFNEFEELIFYSNSLGVREWEIDDPVLYLVSRDEDNGRTLRIVINGNDDDAIEFEIDETVMSWDLAALGITENEGYDISLFEGEDEIEGIYLDVWGFQDPINVDIWDEDEKGKLYNDYTGSVISVGVPEDKRYGTIIVTVNGEDEYSWEVDWEDNYHEWSLSDLGMTDEGEYSIEVKHIVYDEDEIESEDILAEATLMVYTFNNDEFRAILDKDSETLKVYCYEEGTIFITVERESDEEEPEIVNETEFAIENTGEWMEFSLNDLGFVHDGAYYSFDVVIENSEGEEVYHFNGGHSVESVRPDVAEGDFYLDYESNVISVYVPNGNSGKLEVIVNGNVMYISNAYPDREYVWNFKTLNITETGDYAITVRFNGETIAESNINVIEFENDTFRVKCYYIEGVGHYIFCPEDAEGTITVYVYDREQDDELVETHEIPIDDIYKGKWTGLEFETEYDLDENAFIEVKVDGNIINIEEIYDDGDYGVGFEVNHVETGFSFNDGEVVTAQIPYDRTIGNASINITSGEYSFYIKLSEFDGYEWNNGDYKFALTKDDLNYFNELSDKDVIKFVFVHDKGKLTRWMSIKKEDDDFSLYGLTSSTGEFGDIYSYGLEIIMEANTLGEDDEDEEESDEGVKSDYFATVSIPDSFNVVNGKIDIVSGDNIIFSRSLSEINHEYLYTVAGNRYYISFDDLNLDNLNDKDIVNITLTSNGTVIEYLTVVHRLVDGNSTFYEYFDNFEFSVHYGELANPEYGMMESDGSFIYALIPDVMDVTGGNIIISLDDGSVLFNWSLDSFDNTDSCFIKKYSNFYQGFEYIIMANETIYSAFPENVNLTFSFVNEDKTLTHKGIVKDGILHRIVVSDDVTHNMFEIIIPDNVLINGDDFAVTIRNINANRQTIYFDLGGGYFSVYVNGIRMEGLGRLNRYDGETELELTRLCSNTDGVNALSIYLRDLNITDNGVYDIRVTHTTEDEGVVQQESEIFSRNVTLTSNVKVDNVTSEVLTGFGMDPVLMYIDTYYGSIDNVTGKITVLNSTGDEIFTSNIRDLSSQDGRYYLKYSNFENKNFGNQITVVYGDGNERGGNTIVNTTWKDIDASDFTPVVNVTVNDYYGDFINLDLPDLLNDGQIIITIKFKGNHTTNLPNMNVTSDFGSQAVYRFNVADIKANYDTFKLSLSDLGFYEDSGNYDVSVQFTADGTSTLNVTDNTLEVDFLEEILITINETSRYTYELPFAVVRVFEPINAYADLFIDGELYAHVTHFDDGVIVFTSSETWTPGVHTAEIRVVHSEFGSVLNSSSVVFETLTKTEGVEVTVPDNVKENENVIIEITVPKAGNVTIKIDNGEKTVYGLVEGKNSIDLGILAYGNRTIWIDYDGDGSFFTNSVYVFVGDDGHWLTLPDPLVLNDDNMLKFDFGEGASGTLSIYIDDKFIANRTLVNGAAEFVITEEMFLENYQGELLGASEDATTVYGKHTYRIVYTGDSTHGGLTRTGEFTVAYIFKDDLIDEYPLRESYDVTVTLPGDATGKVSLTVNNKKYTSEVKDGKATFKVTDLPMGAHEVLIEHMDDDKYPYANYTAVLNVSYYGVVGEYSDDEKYVSLMLPENATGNLTIFNDNMHAVVRSEQITNGKITMDLNGLPVGIYEIRAYYEGDDYDVRPFDISFRVMPKVNILQGVVMGDDGNIYLDLDGATGHIVIAMDGLSPVVQEITNGTVNYTFSTEGYFYGNHSVTFLYFGHSFDGDIFYEPDGKTPVEYDLLVLPQNTTGELVSDDEGNYIEVRILREDGSLATDANKFVTFYVNGMKYDVVQVYNGIAKLDISKFKNGNYLISWTYSGDNKYASSSGESTVGINRKIVAGAATVLYSANKKYSVTVYNSNKNVAKGVKVTFLINNKAFKTVTTNSKGVASVVITQKPGTYKISAKYEDVSITKTLKVNHVVSLKKVKVKRSAKKLVIKATLKKVNGKYLKSKKVIFKFNGKKYTAKTNKKGIAKVTIKSKVLKKLKVGKKVKYQVTYKKDTVKKTVKVKK